MSLVGNLEDLGLGDILQIVSLSRKSGVLLLRSAGREGKIVFLNGQVIRATSSVSRENLGDLLIRKGLVDLQLLKKALALQQSSSSAPRIGTILAENFGVSRESIDAIVRQKIETTVYSFFGWTEGSFSFELGEPEEIADASLNPLQFMLEQGLNPQWLAMEGSRILDEARHRGESLEPDEPEGESLVDLDALLDGQGASGLAPRAVSAGTGAAAESAGRQILLVDDEPAVCRDLAQLLEGKGCSVETCVSAEEFLQRLEACSAKGDLPLLVIDLIMPRLDGGGLLGGLELLEKLKNKYPGATAVVITDHPHGEAEKQVCALGVEGVLSKPKKSELEGGRGQAELAELAAAIVQLVKTDGGHEKASERLGENPTTINLGEELLREIGEVVQQNRTVTAPVSTGLNLLRGMLQELNNPTLGGGIILLVLRFASEFMNRAVIFLVKDTQIIGLGQFGLGGEAGKADSRVRRMKIPCGEESIFQAVLEQKSPTVVCPGNGRWDSYLQDQLEGGAPKEVFLGPILSEGEVVAVLYGDNLPEQKEIGETEALEIFLSQAGLAMDKALLERRLRGRNEI